MKLFSAFFFIFLLNCSFTSPDYCKLSDQIFFQYSKELKQKGLSLFSKGGAMLDDIREVIVSYNLRSNFKIDEARNLYIGIAEEFLRRYNQDTKIRPFLHNYPFNINNLRLRIRFETETGEYPEKGSLALVFIVRNKLLYEGYDKETGMYYTIYEEPYSEAVKLAKLNNQSN